MSIEYIKRRREEYEREILNEEANALFESLVHGYVRLPDADRYDSRESHSYTDLARLEHVMRIVADMFATQGVRCDFDVQQHKIGITLTSMEKKEKSKRLPMVDE